MQRALVDHYKPQGPGDSVPTDPVAIAVALADKLDTLVGFWSIDEKPTGSKDPYALRRAALGVIRIILDNQLRLRLGSLLTSGDLLSFFHDRLKVQLREQGARHDLVDAVLGGAGEGKDDLLDVSRRVAELGRLLETDDGANLLSAYRRAANILAAEEKKGTQVAASVDPARFVEPEERALLDAIVEAEAELEAAMRVEDYTRATAALAKLGAPADAFFEKVLVNAEDESVRANRLALLARIPFGGRPARRSLARRRLIRRRTNLPKGSQACASLAREDRWLAKLTDRAFVKQIVIASPATRRIGGRRIAGDRSRLRALRSSYGGVGPAAVGWASFRLT